MRVLVAVDLHREPLRVVDAAVAWAARASATIDLVYVNEALPVLLAVHGAPRPPSLMPGWEQIQQHDEAALQELATHVPAGLRGVTLYAVGRAGDEIARRADGYDALIVASHGRRGLAHLWLGSVAERIVRSSPITVVVLKLPPEAA